MFFQGLKTPGLGHNAYVLGGCRTMPNPENVVLFKKYEVLAANTDRQVDQNRPAGHHAARVESHRRASALVSPRPALN